MAPAADGDAKVVIDSLLHGLSDLSGVAADGDVRGPADPAKIESAHERLIAGIVPADTAAGVRLGIRHSGMIIETILSAGAD